MIRPNYKDFRTSHVLPFQSLEHSAKGSTWDEHKYIKRIDGTYYYPDNYEGGRHLPNENEDSIKDSKTLSEADVEKLAEEVILGKFGNGEERRELLGENYNEVQKRVNELMKGSVGSKKISDASEDSIKKVEEISKKITKSPSDSKVHSGVDMDKVMNVYKKKG